MVIVVMGPAGSGKSTVGRALARAIGWRFLDADDIHSAENIARIRRGHPLTDAERAPWLHAVGREIATAVQHRTSLVVACSALRTMYRDALRPANAPEHAVRFVYLKVSASELARRLSARIDHFAPPNVLGSQLSTLEEPAAHETDTVTIDGERRVEEVVTAIRSVTFRNTR